MIKDEGVRRQRQFEFKQKPTPIERVSVKSKRIRSNSIENYKCSSKTRRMAMTINQADVPMTLHV